MDRLKIIILLALVCPLSVLANGSGNEPHSVVNVLSVKSVYDGDTFRAFLPNIIKDQSIRVKGVDTPEIRGACLFEKQAAIKARDFVTSLLMSANEIVLTDVGKDRYGRVLANVIVDGENLSKILIANNLGRKWKGKRENWCN